MATFYITDLIPYQLVGYLTLKPNSQQPIYKKVVYKTSVLTTWIITSGRAEYFLLSNTDFEVYNEKLTPHSYTWATYYSADGGIQRVKYSHNNVDISTHFTE
jgi:hypothetical protein